MEKDIEKLVHKKYNKEDIYIDNNLFISFDDYAIRSNTFQKNVNTTKGRISNQNIRSNIYNNNTTNFNKNNNRNDSYKRLNAIKKCFNLVKNRNELNEILINKCQQELKEKRNENDLKYINVEKENFDNCVFANTCNSFYKRNVDNFINIYLKNNYCVNENTNTLNNDKSDYIKTKNITVNKNSSLYNLTKNNENKKKEEKITVDINKNIRKIKTKKKDISKVKKLSSKKYINVNRKEKLKTKKNNFFSKIKNMFNKKEELVKNNSFCQKNKINNNIINSKMNKLPNRNSSSFIANSNHNIFNYKYLTKNSISKNNISLKKRNAQSKNKDNYNNLKNNNESNNSNSFNFGQKLSFRHNPQTNAITKVNNNNNNSERVSNEKYRKNENLNLNYTMTSPTVLNAYEGLPFKSPNDEQFRKNYIISPYSENLNFSYKSLKEKNIKVDNNSYKFKTLNIESTNNEEIKINKIYKNTCDSNNKIHINKNISNSQEKTKHYKINITEEKYKTLNIKRVPLVNKEINYFSQMTRRDNSSPYIINHLDTNSNIVSEERKKKDEIKDYYNIELNLKSDNPIKENISDKKLETNNIEILSNNTVSNEDKNKINNYGIKNLKNINSNNSNDLLKIKEKFEKILNSKKNKKTIQQKKNNQEENKKIKDLKNKTSLHFFNSNNHPYNNNNNATPNNNNNSNNYNLLKKKPKKFREKHFSDINNTILDKTHINRNNDSKTLLNKVNKKVKLSNDHKKYIANAVNNNKNNANSNNNNNNNKNSNIYKKPFSLSSARDNNYDSNAKKNNEKVVEKRLTKMKSFISTIEKIINVCGSKNNNNNKDNCNIKNKYLETYNNNNNHNNVMKNKNVKKNEKRKNKKNGIKEFEGIISFNVSKIKSKPINNKESIIKKYYHCAIKKEIINNCYINKECKITKNAYKSHTSSENISAEKKLLNSDKLNGGASPILISDFYNNNDMNKNQAKGHNMNRNNSFNYKDNNRKTILNEKGNSYLKINKNNIKNQLNKDTTSLLEYRDLNKKLRFTEQNDEYSNFNYFDEESEVTFGRKDQILMNNKTISNKKPKFLNNYDINNEIKMNIANNNTFCYNSNNEIENDINKEMVLDEESFVNGEVNFYNNNTFKINSNQKPQENNNNINQIVYDFEINSVTNNFYNNNNIILFSPQQKKLYFKYIEKGTIMLSNIFLNHKEIIFKEIFNYSLNKNKNKSESIIYMKKKLKDNGAKKYDSTLSFGSPHHQILSENNKNNNKDNDSLSKNKAKNFFEKKKYNFVKQLKIRTKSSDYILFDKKDDSIIKKVEIETNSTKEDKNELNASFNTPRNFTKEENNIISPHFIDNKEVNSKTEQLINNYIVNNKENEFKASNVYLDKNNLKNFHCTPKFCQIKPSYAEDTKLKKNFIGTGSKKCYSLEEILYFGSCNSLCYQENLLSEEFNSHCDEMLKNVEIIETDKINDIKININEKQIHKYEILSILNKITYLNFDTILEELITLITNDNNYQYSFVKILINKVVKEKKYILLYAKLCVNLYSEISVKVDNRNISDEFNNNLGFDNDLKNILISECKLKFTYFLNEIKNNELQLNIIDVKNKILYFFDFIIELVHLKLILFDTIIYYLEKLYKEFINNNNGNNISILYLDLIIYLLDKTMQKIKNINNKKNKQNFKKLLLEKIMHIFENSELLQNYLKYKIYNIKEKIKIYIDNNSNSNSNNCSVPKKTEIDSLKKDPTFDKSDIYGIISDIFLYNKKEENIKKLIFNDIQNFIKIKNEQIINFDVVFEYNWFIIDELIFDIHITFLDLISCFIDISKEFITDNKKNLYEYFEIALNYFVEYSLDYMNYKKAKINRKILNLFLNISLDNEQTNNEKEFYSENLGYILFLLLNKSIITINDVDIFFNDKKNKRLNVANIIKYVLLFDKEKKGEYLDLFKQTKYFNNNKDFFSDI